MVSDTISISHVSDRLTIVHLVDHVRNVGNGLVNVAVDLACAQADAGHSVAIVSGGGDFEALLAEHGVAHHRLVREASLPGRARMIPRLYRILSAVGPDVVNAHRPYAVAAARLLAPLHDYALIATDHNEFEAKGRVIKLADVVIAVSEGAAASLAASGTERGQIRVVQNGPLFGARQSLVGDTGTVELQRPAIVAVAGLVERKGIYVLLDAFERVARSHRDLHLYFVGDGPERERLAARARRGHASERVHVEGFQTDPIRYVRAADAFVLASFRDPFPLAALEARTAQSAMIVSGVDGLPEAVDGGEAGLIVPPGDAGALADALTEVFRSPDELVHWQTRAGIGLERFTAERMARDTESVYREALAERSPRLIARLPRRPR